MELKLKTIGSDPEFFIRNKADGIFVPSEIITTGTKDNPEKTEADGFLIHKDNLTVEGNIPPSTSKREFIANIEMLKSIIDVIARIRGCELVSDDIAWFKDNYLSLPDATDFSCSKFVNAWNNTEVRTPKLNSNFRTAGFHIHMGYNIEFTDDDVTNFLHVKYKKELVNIAIGRAFDLFLTLPSDNIYRCNERRDKGYGSYGAIRHTSYGLECRTLGSYFTQSKYLDLVYDSIEEMFNWLNEPGNIDILLSLENKMVSNQDLTKLSEELSINKKKLIYDNSKYNIM